jgi:hypothetical protein
MPKSINNNPDKFRIWNSITLYLLTLVAILGFFLLIKITHKSYKTLNQINDNVELLTQPVLLFKDYYWLRNSTGKLDCNNPPTGMVITYQNKSHITIRLYKQTMLINYDNSSHEFSTTELNEQVLPPDGVTTINFEIADFIQDKFKTKINVFDPPFLTFNYTAKISNLNRENEYQVEMINTVGIDCKSFDHIKSIKTLKAEYNPTVKK